MKSLLNREFLDLSGDRNYPLEEGALGVSDGGGKYPDNILSDVQLVLDPSLGNSVFVLSCAVGSELVTVTFAASDEVDTDGITVTDAAAYDVTQADNNTTFLTDFGDQTSFVQDTQPTFTNSPPDRDAILPVAVAIATKEDIRRGLPVGIEPLQDGVSGSVVFDSNTFDNKGESWTFSRFKQSALSRRSYHIMGISRVESLSVDNVLDKVTGDISIEGENGLTATAIHGQEILMSDGSTTTRDVISIGFEGELLKDYLKTYSGECSNRPDSGTCVLGDPILSINGVTPLNNDSPSHNNTIFVLFPASLKPYILSILDSESTEVPSGFLIDSTDLPVNVVCGPRFPDIDDDGTIGVGDCCGSSGSSGCDKDCTPEEGVAGARRGMYFEAPDMPGAYAHICLHDSQLVYHEYNTTLDGVDRVNIYLSGGVGEEYVYAENPSDLAAGIVVYINVMKNTFRVVEDGVQLDHTTGSLVSNKCKTANLVYVDAYESEIDLVIAPVSILDTIDTSRHSLTVSLLVSPASNPTISDPFEADGEFCEKQYGVYRSDDVAYDDKYVLVLDPYDLYPFKFYIQDKGTRLLTSGNFVESGGVLTATLDFEHGGYTYSGTITSAVSTCST